MAGAGRGSLAPPDLQISLAYAGEGRDASLTAYTARGQTWLNAIVPAASALPKAGAARRRLISVAATLLVLPVLPRLAQAATILAVRTWPADEYTRVTLELDSELKAEQFTLENPHRLVVDIEGLTINAALNDLVSKVRPDDPISRACAWRRTGPTWCGWCST